MPFSRSRSIESSTCEVICRLSIVCVASSSRSASVDLPWSMCATMLKLRMRSGGITRGSLATAPLEGSAASVATRCAAIALVPRGGGAWSDGGDAVHGPVRAEVRVLVDQVAVGVVHVARAADIVAVVRILDALRGARRHVRINHGRFDRRTVVARGGIGDDDRAPGWDR